MRLTVLIAGLLLGAIMFLQTFLVSALGSATQDQGSEQAGSIGVMMAFLWLIACAFVMPLPMVSVVVFAIAGLLGFASSGDFSDLAIWGGISLVLAVLSFLGWLGKRKERRQFKVERDQQAARDARLEALLQQQASGQQQAERSTTCPSCGHHNRVGTRFCGDCGMALTAHTV